jgi:hypothetical protein
MFDSTFGNHKVNSEPVYKKQQIPSGYIPEFDSDGLLKASNKAIISKSEYLGKFHSGNRYWCPYLSTMAAFTNSTPIARNNQLYIPFFLERDLTVSEVVLNLTNTGSSGSKLNYGIVASRVNAHPLPGVLIFQSAEFLTSTTGDKASTGLALNIPAGFYFFVLWHNSTSTLRFRGVATTAIEPLLHIGSLSDAGYTHSFSIGKSYASALVNNEAIAPVFSSVSGVVLPVILCKE